MGRSVRPSSSTGVRSLWIIITGFLCLTTTASGASISTTMTVSPFIGGGTQTGDGVAPLTVQFDPILETYGQKVGYSLNYPSGYSSNGMPLIPLPNGDLIFQSESSDNGSVMPMRYRRYIASQGKVVSITPSGDGDYFYPTENIQTCTTTTYGTTYPCVFMNFGVGFNPATSAFTTLMVSVAHIVTGGDLVSDTTLNPNPSDPNFGQSLGIYPPPYSNTGSSLRVTGRDGSVYLINRFQPQVLKYNSLTNTWAPVVGTGVVGSCPDGTAATSCNTDLNDVFVDAQSHIYVMDGEDCGQSMKTARWSPSWANRFSSGMDSLPSRRGLTSCRCSTRPMMEVSFF